MNIEELYKRRFSEKENEHRQKICKILCSDFLQKFIPGESTVIDIGAGKCEFINSIKCGKKYAVDTNKDIFKYASKDVKVFNKESSDLHFLQDNSVDRVFISNVMEHLKSKDEVISTLKEAHRVLRTGGKILLIQPNIRFLYNYYWDYFDHYIPLSDRSLCEALVLCEFSIEKVIPKFVPYTVKNNRLRGKFFLLKLYLRIPVLWNFFGRQMFIAAIKK